MHVGINTLITAKPIVSVIIASYNSGRTIAGTINSLERQTRPECFEVIVVDSSKTDSVARIVEKYPNVSIYRFFQRKLPGDARNYGISKAKGDIIAHLDADCEANEDWIEKIIEAHRSTFPAIGGAIANDSQGNFVSWAAYFCEFSQWMPNTPQQCMQDVAAANMTYKKYLFDRYGRYIEDTYCSDTEFHWRLGENGIRILFNPSLKVTHHSIDRFNRFLKHENYHGACFARVRSQAFDYSIRKRLLYGVLAPLLPFKLFLKVLRFNLKNRVYWHCFLKSIPLLALGIVSWSFGEASGYLSNSNS